MLKKFAMVKYGVFVAKICKHALCASTVRDIWWSPLARQLLPSWHYLMIALRYGQVFKTTIGKSHQ